MANTTKGSGKTKKKTSASGTAKKKQTQTTARKTTAKKSSTAKRTSGTRKNTVREPMDEGVRAEIILLSVLAVSILLMLSNFGMGGVIGQAVCDFFFGLFGVTEWAAPVLIFFGTAFYIANRQNFLIVRKTGGAISCFVFFCAFMQLLTSGYTRDTTFLDYYFDSAYDHLGGGILGGSVVKILGMGFGQIGAWVIIVIAIVISVIVMTQKPILAPIHEKTNDHRRMAEERRQERLARQAAMEEEEGKELILEPVEEPKKAGKKKKSRLLSHVESKADLNENDDTHQMEMPELSIHRGSVPAEEPEKTEPEMTRQAAEEAKKAANELGYPVLVRPSYVLGGQGMQIAISDEDVDEFIGIINRIAQEHPILVDKYLQGKEIEVDAVCDGTDILIPGIMEHIERAGVHSGDSISVYPAQSISQHAKDTIVEYTKRLARSLHVIGMINIQFIVCGEDVYVIEVNPRSSRTVPYISKVTGIPIVPLATKVILGHTIRELGYEPGLQREADYIAIKMPVFSFEKIRGADIALGPEMKSTGECLGIAKTFNEALYKAFLGAGINLPKYKNMIITVKDEDKEDIVPIAQRFQALGYKIYATRNTAKALNENGVNAIRTNKIEQPSPNLMDLILGHKIDLVIDTPSQGVEHSKDGFVIRRNAIETGVNVLTSLDTATALVTSLENTDVKKLTLIDIATIDKR